MKSRLILYVLGFSSAVVSLAQNLYVPLLPQLQQDLHTSMYLVNLSVSFFTIALAVMQVVFGPVIDAKGRRAVLLPGMALYALASLGCSLSGSISMLLLCRVLQGIGAATVPLVAATMIGDLFQDKERARSMATYQMILGLAPAVGPLIGGVIGSTAGYAGAFGFLTVMAALMLAAALVILPETKPAQDGGGTRFRPRSLLRIFRSRTGGAVLLLGFILYYMFYCFIVFLPDLLTHRYELDAKQIGSVFLMLMTFSFIGSKISGGIQAKLGSVKSILVTFSLALFSLLLFMLAAEYSLVGLLVSLAIVGFTAGLTMSVPPTLLAGEFVQERATAIGVYNFVRYLGMAAAPMVGSLLYPRGGSLLLFGAAALMMGLGILYAKRQLYAPVAGNPAAVSERS
ncbi:MFS transporter [Paenibacillus mucilaginosus]|uniref:Major facilitator family transporter n=1 Tax=Paenibacillus mucilaginosus (strain KNP414) TaxID=1036673 RepID=F8FN80_PAEMK|nr:MFS transporter [Paenibacillus mucilaginosus]AEI45750.1 major facilitator family transporter [Paenibacillus mucilaginosus KNP414]MCG7215064.1 MFS transporter [Paenibacillus mucilaginosus]WDM27131.1 MFS transporter [Paenibacillus mucilaginosus]